MLAALTYSVLAMPVVGLLEGIGVPIPGSVVVVGVGMMMDLSWPQLVLLAALHGAGYTLGSLIQYYLGRWVGPRVLQWLPASQRGKVERVLHRYGTGAVLWTRPLAVGNYVSLPAGMIGMPRVRFSLYTFVGIAPWVLATMAAGRLVGGSVVDLLGGAAPYLVPVAVGLAVVLMGMQLWRIREARVAE